MYFESTDFEQNSSLPKGWEESSFKYCNFSRLDIEGRGFEGVLVGCVIERCEWYWSLFNVATFVNVEFKNCVFRGATFSSCSFTECRFIECKFIKDNLGSDCRFDESRWYACTQSDCIGLPKEVTYKD
ncbi:pentapeptide repeat-containing protein [Comamonas sp. Y33R10-2]|uniref:pentapeptide repeat-containing protein n=1 Tax=Comamonas sp. Y33R10-2 TaxID=2853257 RepID=UPI001C5CA816|nr:pentapeptide repeat-containing protein [Comamonas sp. Y33R10-2]